MLPLVDNSIHVHRVKFAIKICYVGISVVKKLLFFYGQEFWGQLPFMLLSCFSWGQNDGIHQMPNHTSQRVMAFLGIQKDTIVTVLPLNQEKKKSSIKFVPTS